MRKTIFPPPKKSPKTTCRIVFIRIFCCCLNPVGMGLLFFLTSGNELFSQTDGKNAIKFAKKITAKDARKHLLILASDEYEGRETGKEGQKKAAKYISENFKNIGLKPAKDNDFFQQFPLVLSTPERIIVQAGENRYENYKDFYVLPYGKDLKLESKSILFLGYGISDSLYDDYKNVEVKGKIVLVLGGEPMSEDSVSFITGTKQLSGWTTRSRKKSEFAKEKGAEALIVINKIFDASVQSLKSYLESPSMKLETMNTTYPNGEKKKMPSVIISIKMANAILSAQNLPGRQTAQWVDTIQKNIRTAKQPVSFEIKLPFTLEIKNKADKISSENVLGIIEGSEFKDEVVFITAHYDHLGVQDGKVYNGADDDGSGTVGVLEIAKAFAKAKTAGLTPKRTIAFMTVSGEEKGLLGSSYYTDNPVFPIANTVCDLNIDMIGRVDDIHKDSVNYIYIIGSDKISTELHKINEQANSAYTKLKLDYKYNNLKDPNRFYYRSDHYNFAEKGIPVIFYFNGTHKDYHQETDEVSKINFDLLAKRARLIFYTAWEVANRKERIKSDVLQEKPAKGTNNN